MSLVLYFIVFVIGIILGAIIYSMIPKKELNVEDAISLLRTRGYWVNINVKPEGTKDE